ncbi:glycosyltransferase family 4 protein [Paraeggerthella sp.]|uniref:glycosyltransferase family 4 protein n=2 Tax=Eggerthellaceae TaxID=1643826 RepID=UPI003526F557
MNRRILILGNSRLVVFGFRGELIDELVERGCEVYVAFPNGPFGEGSKESASRGCKYVEVDINRRGKNPAEDIGLFRKYRQIMQKVKPDAVLAYTVKCDIYGGLAARSLRIPFFPNITGLGKALDEGGLSAIVVRRLYKSSIKEACCVFFQNSFDYEYFKKHNLIHGSARVLPGSGINLSKFKPLEYRLSSDVRFTFIGRLMKAKGIDQFLDAARELSGSNVEFHICGYCEEEYGPIVEKEQAAGNVMYHGLVDDVSNYIADSDCIVLPTYHPEGISNVLLEAAASARPIITTDRHGCREVVEDGVNGYLVRQKDSQDLIDKMRIFMSLNPQLRISMGKAGREKVEREFDRSIVVHEYLKALDLA